MLPLQVLFQNGKFQWKRLEKLIALAKEGSGGLDLSDTVRDGARVVLLDDKLRMQLLNALTEDNRLHVEVRMACQKSEHDAVQPGGGGPRDGTSSTGAACRVTPSRTVDIGLQLEARQEGLRGREWPRLACAGSTASFLQEVPAG